MRIAPKTFLLLVVAVFPIPLLPQELTKQQEQSALQAVAVLDEAVNRIAHIEDSGTRVRATMLAAQAYSRAGRREQAVQTVRQLLDSFPTPARGHDPFRERAAVESVRTLSSLNAQEEATVIAATIQNESSRWFALSAVAGAYARAGDFAAALETISAIPAGMSRDSTYQQIAYTCVSRRDWSCASASAEAIADPAMKTQSLSHIASFKAQRGAPESAAVDAAQARTLAESLPNSGRARSTSHFPGCSPSARPTPRDSALHKVAESQAVLGDFQGMRETLASIQDIGVRENVLIFMSMAAARKGDFTNALSVAGEVTRPDCRSVALSWLASHQYRAGDVAAARGTLAGIPSVSERVFAFLNISRVQEDRDGESPATTLALAAELALQVPDPLERLDTLLQVAHRQAAVGLHEQLGQTLRGARDLAGQNPAGRSDVTGRNWGSVLLSVAELLAESGDLAGAIEVARNSGFQNPASVVARGAARGGHLSAVREWADSLPPADRTLALIGIATGILDRARIGRSPASSL